MKYTDNKPKDSRSSSNRFPIKQSPTLVVDRIQYAPNYDTKRQTGMEAAMQKVGKKCKGNK